MANISKDKLIAITVASLRARWRSIRARLLRGHWAPAGEKGVFDCFEADTVARQKNLARRFYSLKHADKVLSWSDSKLRSNISYYTEIAVEHAWDEFDDFPDEQRDYMRSLPKFEYVRIADGRVEAYPARVLYDDWYECSIGAMSNYSGLIMKSTGENFSKLEADWLDASIRKNVRSSCEFWRTDTFPEAANRIAVGIVELDRIDYLFEIEDGLRRGTKAQLIALMRYLRDTCSEHRHETHLIEGMLSKLATAKKSELFEGFWKMLQSQRTAEVYPVMTAAMVESNWNIPRLPTADQKFRTPSHGDDEE